MKKFITDNLIFIVIAVPAAIGLLFLLLYNLSQNDWEYTVAMIFWTIAVVSIPVTFVIYKFLTKKRNK